MSGKDDEYDFLFKGEPVAFIYVVYTKLVYPFS